MYAIISRARCSLSELTSPNVTTAETRELPQVPGTSSPASRIPIGRPRLEVPQPGVPQTSGEDDGLLTYWLRYNGTYSTNITGSIKIDRKPLVFSIPVYDLCVK